MKTEMIRGSLDGAAEIIKRGGLVAVPTETVYGLAGNGLDESAVRQIYEVKGRPAIKPLSLMVPDAEAIADYCLDPPPAAYALARRFWPGPLTIVMQAKSFIPSIVLAGGDTVGLRCPMHPMTLELLRLAGLPFAAPSANPSSLSSPKNAAQVLEYFEGRIEAIVDGGDCGLGTESTIIDLSQTPYRILRQGALPAEDIADALAEDMTLIGITGGSGCGKTTALEVLREMGAPVIDCDALYHELLESDRELLGELDRAFPGTVREGRLDRKALGATVFADNAALERLNGIAHGHIIRELRRRLGEYAMAGDRVAAVDAIGLISGGLAGDCSATVAVCSTVENRVRRIMARDGISRDYALLRINAQPDDEYFSAGCDYTLRNDGSSRQFQDECRILFKEIISNGKK